MKIVVDAHAWIELFIGSEKGEKARESIEKATETYTPDTVLAEVARKYLREKAGQDLIIERLKTIVESSEIAFIDEEVALEAAKCYVELSEKAKNRGLGNPSLLDAMVLATARRYGAKILTGDEHLNGLPETVWIK